jgi:trimeric autotransporter adhesin
MKINLSPLIIMLAMLAAIHPAAAQGTAFTYQGRLNSGANPANGSYDFTFSLYDTNQPGGNLIAGPVTNSAIAISNGLFTTTIEFGPGVFTGGSNWLAIAVRTNAVGSFTMLSSWQQVTPAPYAITAANLASVVQNNTLPGGVFATIGGGQGNFILAGADHTTISGGGGNAVTGGGGTVGGGNNNAVSNYNATISGGANNVADGNASTVGGGSENLVTGSESAIGGGQHNVNNGDHSAIGGGQSNVIQALADRAVISGGYANIIAGSELLTVCAVIGGGYGNTIQTNISYSTIGGGYFNQIQSYAAASTIGGGDSNIIQTNADRSTIGGGQQNQIQTHAFYSTIGGGYNNQIQPNASTSAIGGGYSSVIQTGAYNSTIGGGQQNQIQTNAIYSTIGGGLVNLIKPGATYSTIGGGYDNQVTNSYATVPGGYDNEAGGLYSFAAGQQAQALHQGAFVWADSQNSTFASTRNDQFSIRAGGGVVMNVSGSSGLNPPAVAINSSSGNGIGLVVNESSTDTSVLFANNGSGDIIKGFSGGGNTVFEVLNDGTVKSKGFTLTSDRNAKQNFATLDRKVVLAKVISLPVTEWNYRDDPADKKHIGPMAQDFHAAFQLDGGDDKHISVVDEGGVALAAIQGLNQKLQEELNRQDTENIKLKRQNDSLNDRLNELEAVVRSIAEKK